LWLEGVPW